MTTPIAWGRINEANRVFWDVLSDGMRDGLSDDAIDVTSALLDALGVDSFIADSGDSRVEDARTAIQSFVQIALMHSGMYHDGRALALHCIHESKSYDRYCHEMGCVNYINKRAAAIQPS